MPHRQVPVLPEPFHPLGTGATAPGQQRLNIPAPARQQKSRRQQGRNGLVSQKTGLRHPEALNHRVGEIHLDCHR